MADDPLRIPGGFRGDRWRQFSDSVANLNEFVRPDVLRKYQSDILNTGRFEVVSPKSADVVTITRSVNSDDYIAYPLPDDSGVWLIASFVALGYPLCAAYVSRRKRTFPLMRLIIRQEQRIDELDFEFLPSSIPPDAEPHGRSMLIIGHKNFAHHLWNELPAVEEWLRRATPERIAALSIKATDEPLGALKQIFPELSAANLLGPTDDFQRGIAVHAGAQLVTAEIRRRLRDFATRQGPDLTEHPAQSLLSRNWPRIWISIRQFKRTANNFDEFFLALVGIIFTRYPNAAVFLDGFSFPFGFFDDSRTIDHREAFSWRADEAANEIAELMRSAEAKFGAAVASRICSISGIDLLSAIAIGGCCDYYICHYGTLQHKIAWVHNIPGMLHGPHTRGPESESIATRWHAGQVDGGVLPDIVPQRLIITDHESRKNPWDLDYRFSDPDQVAEFVADLMQARLAWTADSAPPENCP